MNERKRRHLDVIAAVADEHNAVTAMLEDNEGQLRPFILRFEMAPNNHIRLVLFANNPPEEQVKVALHFMDFTRGVKLLEENH